MLQEKAEEEKKAPVEKGAEQQGIKKYMKANEPKQAQQKDAKRKRTSEDDQDSSK